MPTIFTCMYVCMYMYACMYVYVYVFRCRPMYVCRGPMYLDKGCSDQRPVGPMGRRTNGLSDQWVVGLMSRRTIELSPFQTYNFKNKNKNKKELSHRHIPTRMISSTTIRLGLLLKGPHLMDVGSKLCNPNQYKIMRNSINMHLAVTNQNWTIRKKSGNKSNTT